MYNGLLHTHSGLRWIVLALLVFTVIKAFIGWMSKSGYSKSDRLAAMITKISVDIQFVVGLILYFVSPKVMFSDGVMGNNVTRFFTVEHVLMMIVAIALISIGNAKAKKLEYDLEKHKQIAIFYGIALLIILAAIPWPFRGLGAGWF